MTLVRNPDELAAMARVMQDLSCEIEQLGAVLCCVPGLAGSHARELQAIDLIAQMQQALASLLSADCMACAIDDVRIDMLRERMRACLPVCTADHAWHSHDHGHAHGHAAA